MEKERIEIHRISPFPQGYGTFNSPTEDQVLDKIIEWSRLPKNLNKKVYKHFITQAEENFNGLYDFSNWAKVDRPEIRSCDLVYYLDIYYQGN